MKVSFFLSSNDPTPRPLDFTWAELVERIKTEGHSFHPVDAKEVKEGCPMLSPAEFRGDRRSIKTAIQVHFGALDLDHKTPEEIGAFVELAQSLELELLLYSSWKHSPTNVSLRAFFPLSRAVLATEWPTFWPRMNAILGNFGDPHCKNVDRCYFLPSTAEARREYAEIIHIPGSRPLDVDRIKLTSPANLPPQAVVRVPLESIVAFQRRLVKKNPETGLALGRVLRSEPWAEEGQRDSILWELSGDLVSEFPTLDPDMMAQVFAGSASHWPDFPVSLIADKFRRQQREMADQQEQEEQERIGKREVAIRAAFRSDRSQPYTQEELDAFAAHAGCTLEDFGRRWIVQCDGCYYFFLGGRGYVGPYTFSDGKLAAHIFLAPAASAGVRLLDFGNGGIVERSAESLAMEYGSLADQTVLDLTAQYASFDAPSATIIEAPTPLRQIQAQHHPDVELWLRTLAGEQWENLQQWLAWVTDLSKPSAALFLEGPPGIGKSLLAKGLARLWSLNGPTMLDQAMGAFNSALENCPLVFGDEILPKDFRGKSRTGELREIIQADTRPFKRKFKPDATVKGAMRVVLAANNRGILDGEDGLTPWDVEAIVGRFLHVQGSEEAGAVLRDRTTFGWVSHDLIAAHVLWMVQHVMKNPQPPRFLVDTSGGKLARHMVTGTSMGSAVAHWLLSFLTNPLKLRAGKPIADCAHFVHVKDGHLLVHTRTLCEYWDVYPTNVPAQHATARNVVNALKGMCQLNRLKSLLPNGYGRTNYYTLDVSNLVEWAKNTGFATEEEILAAIDKVEKMPLQLVN